MQKCFATALKAAQELITQQGDQIQTDAEKIERLQQALATQCSLTTEREIELGVRLQELQERRQQLDSLEVQFAEVVAMREQTEALADRQAVRLAALNQKLEAQANRLEIQSTQIDHLTQERDEYQSKLPSGDDETALADLNALLAGRNLSSSHV